MCQLILYFCLQVFSWNYFGLEVRKELILFFIIYTIVTVAQNDAIDLFS